MASPICLCSWNPCSGSCLVQSQCSNLFCDEKCNLPNQKPSIWSCWCRFVEYLHWLLLTWVVCYDFQGPWLPIFALTLCWCHHSNLWLAKSNDFQTSTLMLFSETSKTKSHSFYFKFMWCVMPENCSKLAKIYQSLESCWASWWRCFQLLCSSNGQLLDEINAQFYTWIVIVFYFDCRETGKKYLWRSIIRFARLSV